MSMLKEFKAFAMRGNVVDLAVGVVIGVAFGKIITSLVSGIIMPMIGLLIGGINIADKSFKFGDATVQWGLFLQSVIDFTIIAFAIFLLVKLINQFQNKQEEKPVESTQQEILLREIRDLLKANLTR